MSNMIDTKSALPKSLNAHDLQQGLQNKGAEKQSLSTLKDDVAHISSLSSSKSLTTAIGYSETLSISMTTKEGDEVTVDFKQLYAQYKSYKEAQSASKGEEGSVKFFASTEEMEASQFEEQFAFSVNGELNEQELKAVYDVFAQVDKLANKFFDGNIESALAQAKSLNIDFNQLQSLSFKVTQTAVAAQQAKSSAYADIQGQGVETAHLQEIPAYLQRWQQALARLEAVFQDAQKSFDELMSGALEQRFPEQDTQQGWFERVSSFHEDLLNFAKAQSEAVLNENESVEDAVEPSNVRLDATAEERENSEAPEEAVPTSPVDIKV